MQAILLVGIGGFLGAVSRFGLSQLIRQYHNHPFPIATLMINVLGSMGIGLLFEFYKNHHRLPSITLLCIVGFLGSFTTFSTFSYETVELLRKNEYYWASLNILASLGICFVGVLLGCWLGQVFKA